MADRFVSFDPTYAFDATAPPLDGAIDELDEYVASQMEQPAFRKAYEDAAARHAIIDALVARRRELNLSQRQVSARMGGSCNSAWKLENQSTYPSVWMVQRYARAVGLRLGLVLTKED